MNKEDLPKDHEELLKELSARIKLKDTTEFYKLKQRLSVKWWESLVLILLFASTLGFILTAIQLLVGENIVVRDLFLFFFLLFILALLATIEFMIINLNTLRRLNQFYIKLLTSMREEMIILKQSAAVSDPPVERTNTSDT